MIPPRPDAASLHEAATAYLARYAATRASLLRVLDRRIARWTARVGPDAADPETVAGLREAARSIVERLVRAGAVDDAAFARQRAARLVRMGRSPGAIRAHLAGKGIARSLAAASVSDDPEIALRAALAFARRRRLGPFAPDAGTPDPHRTMAAFARAGFARATAEQVLRLGEEEARAALRGEE